MTKQADRGTHPENLPRHGDEDRPDPIAPTVRKGAPLEAARLFLDERYTKNNVPMMRSWRDDFYVFAGARYKVKRMPDLRAELYAFLADIRAKDDKGNSRPFDPNKSKVAGVIDALVHLVSVGDEHAMPFWLPPHEDRSSANLLACRDGLLNVVTGKWRDHSPHYFNSAALPFDYDERADCPRWVDFLHDLWPGREGKPERRLLGEMFGYLLTADTSQQKIFFIVGPKRSGKGTISRILTKLIGKHAIANPTLASLSGEFGMTQFINKRLAIVTDARLAQNASNHRILERLLTVSGEDDQSVNRKNKEFWHGRLGTRFLLFSNELPAIRDSSGALASRFVILTMRHSFYGKENPTLAAELEQELPGILNWALSGLDRLRDRGHFEMPLTSKDAVRQLEDLASPVGAFLRDWCERGPRHRVSVRTLFDAWRAYCAEAGEQAGSDKQFGKNLRAVYPEVEKRGRVPDHFYQGIRLSEDGERRR